MSKKRKKNQKKQQQTEFSIGEHVFYFDEETGEQLFTKAEQEAIQELASEMDRDWFSRHPSAKAYMRPYRFGEFPASTRTGVVLVRQIKPGFRVRTMLVPEWAPMVYLRLGEDGEVLGKYSEFEGWDDVLFQRIKQALEGMD